MGRALLGWLMLCVIASMAACAKPTCTAISCPTGHTCDEASGQCRSSGPKPAEATLLRGKVSWLGAGPTTGWVLGHAPLEHSLALLPTDGGAPTWIAGPRAVPDEPPAGEASAGTIDGQGQVHLAWLRAADKTVWSARGTPAHWQRDPTPLGTAAGPSLALALSGTETVVAWPDNEGVRVARGHGGAWLSEVVPSAPPGKAATGPFRPLGAASLEVVAIPSGIAVASYDALGGDLMLAVRSGSGWKVARIAGRDPVNGNDQGDVGDTLAMAAGPGGKLVIAYRDRSRGRVMVATSQGGVVSHAVVDGGLQTDVETGLARVGLLGSALDVAVLADGRAVVALQDASRARIRIAVESPSGGYVVRAVGGSDAKAWPVFGPWGAGGLPLGWLTLAPERGPGGLWHALQLQDEVVP